MSVPFEFRALESTDDLHWAASNLREDVGKTFTTMRTTTLRRIYEIYMFKVRKEDTSGGN